MKAITILQPWATLIALGEKIFETRGWATSHSGPLAIHAGKKIDRDACEQGPIKYTLSKYGYTADNLPTGAVLAKVQLTNCYSVKRDVLGGLVLLHSDSGKGYFSTEDDEFYFGDFTSGRFAWELTNVQRLAEPIPARGQQRIWTWEGSADA